MAGEKEAGILQSFWGLSSLVEKEREDSARELLAALLDKQVYIHTHTHAAYTYAIKSRLTCPETSSGRVIYIVVF